jgi:hypothetical protein
MINTYNLFEKSCEGVRQEQHHHAPFNHSAIPHRRHRNPMQCLACGQNGGTIPARRHTPSNCIHLLHNCRCNHRLRSKIPASLPFRHPKAIISLTLRPSAMCLMVGANYCGYVVALSWISNGMPPPATHTLSSQLTTHPVLPRPPSKRAAALAGINALSNVAQIYSPFLYPSKRAPPT